MVNLTVTGSIPVPNGKFDLPPGPGKVPDDRPEAVVASKIRLISDGEPR